MGNSASQTKGGNITPSNHENSIQSEDTSKILVDYRGKDYRGFIFVVHDKHGLMLLHCTRKKTKPSHWQIPGGHVDEQEFIEAAKHSDDEKTQLMYACRAAAARELFEETGINVRDNLDRLTPVTLRDIQDIIDGKESLVNEYKDRLFFFLTVDDNDFLSNGKTPVNGEGRHLKLKLSEEHSGFMFEPEPSVAAELLKYHSGGKCSQALLMSMQRGARPEDLARLESARISPRRSKSEKGNLDVFPQPEKKNHFCCTC